MKNIKNVIFDLDGTLIDSSNGVVAAVNHALTRAGDPLPPPENIKRFIGYSLETMFPHFSKAPVEQLTAFFQEKANELVVGASAALPGADWTVRNLHQQGFRLGIATTKHVRNIEGILAKLGWNDLFVAYSGGNEVKKVKPDPEVMYLTLDRMQASAAETVVIGDTINDVVAAQAVPMLTIAVASPFEDRATVIRARPDHFVESIRAIVDLLGDPAPKP